MKQERAIQQNILANMETSQKALNLDQQRSNQMRQLQKRQILDQAYKLVETRQKNIDEMMKHVHVINNKPTFVPPSNSFQMPVGSTANPYGQISPSKYGGAFTKQPVGGGRSSSLTNLYHQSMVAPQNLPVQPLQLQPPMGGGYQPVLMAPQQHPYPQQYPISVPSGFPQQPYGMMLQQPQMMMQPQQPMYSPYGGGISAQQQLMNPQDMEQQHQLPRMSPAQRPSRKAAQDAPVDQGAGYIASQHTRPDIRQILDQNTFSTQSQQDQYLELKRKKLLQEFADLKSKEIDQREQNQKQYYTDLGNQLQTVSSKEQQLHDSLAFQQNLLYQMMNNVSSSSTQAESQKDKNRKLNQKVKDFERKNKNMKEQINQALLLNVGNKVIDEIKPTNAEVDDVAELRLQLQALVQNKKLINIKNPQLIESDNESSEEQDSEENN